MKLTVRQLRETIEREIGRLDESRVGFPGFGFAAVGGRPGPEIDGFGGHITRRQIDEEDGGADHELKRIYQEFKNFSRLLAKFIDVGQESGALVKGELDACGEIENRLADVAESIRERMSGEPKTLRSR